jgi:hypothetical protein
MLVFIGLFAAAQEADTAADVADTGASVDEAGDSIDGGFSDIAEKPKLTLLEALQGLQLGIELYGRATPGYNVRYLEVTPRIYYGRNFVENFSGYAEIKLPIGLLPRDPNVTYYYNGVENDIPFYGNQWVRTVGLGFFGEEGLNYKLPIEGVGFLDFDFYNEDTIYIMPSDPDYNMFEGRLEPSFKFTYLHELGDMYGKLGVPVDYAQRELDSELGLGLALLLGYYTPKIGLGVELTLNLALIQEVQYTDTELGLSYDWTPYFRSELDFIARDAFKSFDIKGEIHYDIWKHATVANTWPVTFKAGFEFTGIGSGDVLFSPMMGFVWNF